MKQMELPERTRTAEQLAQQAWQGRVDWGEERAAGTAALRRYKIRSVWYPRGAGKRRDHAFGGG